VTIARCVETSGKTPCLGSRIIELYAKEISSIIPCDSEYLSTWQQCRCVIIARCVQAAGRNQSPLACASAAGSNINVAANSTRIKINRRRAISLVLFISVSLRTYDYWMKKLSPFYSATAMPTETGVLNH